MRRTNYSLFLLLFYFVPSSFGQELWYSITDFPGSARDDAASFVIGSNAYVGTGFMVGFQASRDFYRFNMQTDTWESMDFLPLGEERQYAVGFSVGIMGYLFGGLQNGIAKKDLWQYNPTSDEWTLIDSIPSFGRYGATQFVLNNTVYFVGGKNSQGQTTNEVWSYEPSTGTWTQKNNFPDSIWRASSAVASNLAFVTMGSKGSEHSPNIYTYDNANDAWNLETTFPTSEGLAYHQSQYFGGEIYIIFGMTADQTTSNKVWMYHPILQQWTQHVPLYSIPRKGGVSFTNGQDLYYTTGLDSASQRMTQTLKHFKVIGIEESKDESLIYPNPSKGFLNFPEKWKGHPYSIIGADGREVKRGELKKTIDLFDLPEGIYYCVVNTEVLNYTEKFILRF